MKVIPRKKVPLKLTTPWITQDIRQDIKPRREHYFRRAKQSCSLDWTLKYKSLRNEITNKICKAKRSFFESLATPHTIEKFWAIVRSLNPWSMKSPCCLSDGRTSVTSNQDKANLLNDFFTVCFNQVKLPSFNLPTQNCQICPLIILTVLLKKCLIC